MRTRRLQTVIVLVVMALIVMGCAPIPVVMVAQESPSAAPAGQAVAAGPAVQQTTATMKTHPSRGEPAEVAGSRALLFTTEEGAMLAIQTSDLEPGHVYTAWFIAINNPAACATLPCTPSDVMGNTQAVQADIGYADSLIASEDGTGRFAAYIPVGPLSHAWYGTGLTDPLAAEIHVTLNDHGPLVPELAESMLSSYRGGCTDESLPAAFPDTAKADGEAGPNTCQLFQFTQFQQ